MAAGVGPGFPTPPSFLPESNRYFSAFLTIVSDTRNWGHGRAVPWPLGHERLLNCSGSVTFYAVAYHAQPPSVVPIPIVKKFSKKPL